MTVNLSCNNFFAHYIIDTQSADLSGKDRRIALICSIALGIFTLGLVHLFVALKVHVFTNKTVTNDSQEPSLKEVKKVSQEEMKELCKKINIKNRDDYIKYMLFFAVNNEYYGSNAYAALHEMIPHFQDGANLKQFVHEDIQRGRENEDDTLLHEILKCKLLSPKDKASAFEFMLTSGHDHLGDYIGNRTLGNKTRFGGIPTTFPVVKWGSSLKETFDNLPPEEKRDFLSHLDRGDRKTLREFTGIEI